MVDKDIILEKIGQIQNCLKRIRDTIGDNVELLHEYDEQDIFVLNLQRGIQACLDLAAHIISDQGLGVVDELKDNFLLLEKNKIVDKILSKRLQKMVGFRNIAVHDYSALDVDVLKAIYANHLGDLEVFYKTVGKYLKIGV